MNPRPSEQRNKSLVASLIALALFNFVFLGGEFFFDREIGGFVSPERVVDAQGLILGASVLGFLAFAPLWMLAQKLNHTNPERRTQKSTVEACAAKPRGYAFPLAGSSITAAIAIASCIAVYASSDFTLIQIAGCLGFFALGIFGSWAHWNVARSCSKAQKQATAIGFAYAAGILLQFASNHLLHSSLENLAALCLGTCALSGILIALAVREGAAATTASAPSQAAALPAESSQAGTHPTATPQSAQPLSRALLSHALWLVALVALLACLFSTLDGVITVADAQGSISVEDWPRLFLAASGLLAGFLFDIRGNRYRGLLMLCITLLSAISVLAVEAGANALIGLLVFYASSGFFVVFFTTTFIELSLGMHVPPLWAGMGRATNNLCSFALAGSFVAFAKTNDIATIMIAVLVLFVLTIVAFTGAGLFRFSSSEKSEGAIATTREAPAAPAAHEAVTHKAPATPATAATGEAEDRNEEPSPEKRQERLRAFAQEYQLTPRELDVLAAVTANEQPLKQVADDLGISLRMVQRHLTSIYEKTSTQTRAGLARKCWEKRY